MKEEKFVLTDAKRKEIEWVKAYLVKRWFESLDESEEEHNRVNELIKNCAFCFDILEGKK